MSEQRALILIVDDEENNRDMLARRLMRSGFDVETAADAREGLKLIISRPIDLVLLDQMMPNITGLEALNLVRQKYSADELPVIMVTARQDVGNIDEAMRVGANDYVTKPVDFPALLSRIKAQLLRKRTAMKAGEAAG